MLPNSKIKAIGLLVAVAMTGFAAGAATMSRADTRAPVPTDWRERCRYSGMLKDQLKLSDAQSDSIRSIMRAHRTEMTALMQKVKPQMDSLQAIVRAEVRAVMTPAQAMQYDSLRARERAERLAREHADTTGGRPAREDR
jgi:Spy/CpxP family protein refolding chaperone